MNGDLNRSDPGPQVRHELDAIRSYLTAAQDVMRTGHMPLLVGLEDRVAQLCEMIKAAPKHTQKEFLLELTALVEDLNATEQAVKATAPKIPGETNP